MHTSANPEYQLLDSGHHRKLERFGPITLDRPRGGAVWAPRLPQAHWDQADARFEREDGNQWTVRSELPEQWIASLDGLQFYLRPTDFGHLGLFPEHREAWRWMERHIAAADRQLNILNLFAYTGGASLAAARAGAKVCHLDASKKSVAWARENADLNHMTDAPIRWITDDVFKFLKREQRRESTYDGIILDPPNFGRGTRQEVFKIDDHIGELLADCRAVLTRQPAFVILTCHANTYSPLVLHHLLHQTFGELGGGIDCGEMTLSGDEGVLPVPNGTYAVWSRSS